MVYREEWKNAKGKLKKLVIIIKHIYVYNGSDNVLSTLQSSTH